MAMTLLHGVVFAQRFVIDRPAESGGMGMVYRAQDRYSGAFVALKLLHSGMSDAGGEERFEREAVLLSELVHPAIVHHVAHGRTPDGQIYLAMEWLQGEDLAARLRRGPLAIGEAVELTRRVARALEVAHGRGVVHRDIKPSN